MQVYKYSDEGIDHLVRENLIRSGTVLGLGVLAVFGVLIFINGVSELPLFLPGFALVDFLLGWTQYRGLGKVRSLLQSTEFELDEEEAELWLDWELALEAEEDESLDVELLDGRLMMLSLMF